MGDDDDVGGRRRRRGGERDDLRAFLNNNFVGFGRDRPSPPTFDSVTTSPPFFLRSYHRSIALLCCRCSERCPLDSVRWHREERFLVFCGRRNF